MADFVLIAAVGTLILALLLHRIFFRRSFDQSLRLPPGPKPWPIIGNFPDVGQVTHQSLSAMARRYGPLIYLRLGCVDVVVASSAPVAKQLLKFRDANFSNRPPNAGAKYLAYDKQDLVFAPYGPRWRTLRKISAVHMLSVKALDDYQCMREEEVAMLVRAIGRAGEAPVNLGSLLNLCATNLLGRLMLARRVFGDGGGSHDPKADEFKSIVVEALALAGEFSVGDFIPALKWLNFHGVAAKMKQLHKRFDAFLTEIVEEHKMLSAVGGGDSGGVQQCLLSTLLSLKDQADDEDGKLTDIEIKALLLDMFIAGTDTSSSTVEWAMAELIKHPKILAQVQEELDSVVGRDRPVSELDLPQLTYLQAVVKETLRLHPPVSLILRMGSESCEINGYHIPQNSTLLVNAWAIGRDPNEWAGPLEFRPERFLPGHGEKAHIDVKGTDFEMIPFGAGRRMCVGMGLGLRMVQLVTATLGQAFNWKLGDGLEAEKLSMDEVYGLTLQRAQPLIVNPWPRLSPNVYPREK